MQKRDRKRYSRDFKLEALFFGVSKRSFFGWLAEGSGFVATNMEPWSLQAPRSPLEIRMFARYGYAGQIGRGIYFSDPGRVIGPWIIKRRNRGRCVFCMHSLDLSIKGVSPQPQRLELYRRI